MNYRTAVRLSRTLLAVFAVGCSDLDGPSAPDTTPELVVTPSFKGIEPGETVQLVATLGGQPAQVTWASSNTAIATVSATGLVTGVAGGSAAATATLTADPQRLRSASITVIPVLGIALTSGVPVTGLSSSGARGTGVLYRIFVPAGKTSLTVTLRGGTGDADIYVRRQTPPTNSSYTFYSYNGGNDEDIVIANPASGSWYILLDLWDAYTGATLTATFAP